MSYAYLSDVQVKALLKQAFLELFQEQRSLFYELFAEVLEDLALARAIEEGASTESVSKAEVLHVLEAAP